MSEIYKYEQLEPFFSLITKIVWSPINGGVEIVEKDNPTIQCSNSFASLPNMLDRAVHKIRMCFHRKNDITKEDLQSFLDELLKLQQQYEIKELNEAIEGLTAVIIN